MNGDRPAVCRIRRSQGDIELRFDHYDGRLVDIMRRTRTSGGYGNHDVCPRLRADGRTWSVVNKQWAGLRRSLQHAGVEIIDETPPPPPRRTGKIDDFRRVQGELQAARDAARGVS